MTAAGAVGTQSEAHDRKAKCGMTPGPGIPPGGFGAGGCNTPLLSLILTT